MLTPAAEIRSGAGATGPAPAHVMTRTTNDFVHVSQNGANDIVELFPGATSINRFIPVGNSGESVHPHAHWMSADGNMMVTPNEDGEDSTLYDFPSDSIAARTATGHSPIATGMMPDSSKYYVANFLDNTISVITNTIAARTTNACGGGPTNFMTNSAM